MATPRQIRSRIRVAKNIQQITKAMKMVAAARLRRAQESVIASRPYSQKMQEVLQSLASQIQGSVRHPLLRKSVGEPRNIGVILITGDRGLCGSYNSSAIKLAVEASLGFGVQNTQLVTVGKKGTVFFRRRGYTIASEHSVPATGLSFVEAQALARAGRELFESEEIDRLVIVYTRFYSAMTQKATTTQLLPIETLSPNPAPAGPKSDVIFEPGAEELMSALLPRYVDTLVHQAVLESVASEHGARMTSMSSATDNAGKMISRLTLSLNRARQATITKEIAEIVGGAEALK